jgi:hypothetical protein
MAESFYLSDGGFGRWVLHLFVPPAGGGWDEWLGRWIAALLTLALYSFLFRDNAVFRLAERIFIGVGTGYVVARNINDAVLAKAVRPLFFATPGTAPDPWLVIPLALGLVTLSRVIPNVTWLSRWPIAFVAGVTMGLAIITNLQSNVVTQVEATLRPFRFIDEAWADHTFRLRTPEDEAKAKAKGEPLDRLLAARRLALVEAARVLAQAGPAERTVALEQARKIAAPALAGQDRIPVEPLLDAIEPGRARVRRELEAALALDRAATFSRYAARYLPPGAPSGPDDLMKDPVMDRIAADSPGVVPEELPVKQRDLARIGNACLIALGVLSGLIYFFFSKEHTGLVFGGLARVGIWFLMISFGASFGYTVMARISLLIGRMQFLMGDWLHLSRDFSGIVSNF